MKKYWFFDLDGTLADTDEDIRGAWKASIKDLGLDMSRFKELFWAGPSIDEMTKILYPEIYTEELVSKIRERYSFHYDNDGFPSTQEYPGIIDFIKKLRLSGAKTYIATNKRFAGTLQMVAKFGWGNLFDGVYSGDMYMDDPSIGKMRKPALLKFIMQKESILPSEVVMVGDTENDFEAARENSIESIGVKWGYGSDRDKPDCWVRSAEELFSLVFN